MCVCVCVCVCMCACVSDRRSGCIPPYQGNGHEPLKHWFPSRAECVGSAGLAGLTGLLEAFLKSQKDLGMAEADPMCKSITKVVFVLNYYA